MGVWAFFHKANDRRPPRSCCYHNEQLIDICSWKEQLKWVASGKNDTVTVTAVMWIIQESRRGGHPLHWQTKSQMIPHT